LLHHQLITTWNCKSCQVFFAHFLVFWFLFVCEKKQKVKKRETRKKEKERKIEGEKTQK